MKEKHILFSGPMVRAILDGRKTQTRRIVKPQPRGQEYCGCGPAREYHGPKLAGKWGAYFPDFVPCPYGQPGDRLWCKETFRIFDSSTECACYDECRCARGHGKPVFRADSDDTEVKWRPSIFMPRWASRITREVTAVRVERLQDISADDARAEGVHDNLIALSGNAKTTPFLPRQKYDLPNGDAPSPDEIARANYAALWESINGPGSWDANPWVWVIEFKRIGQ